MKKRLTIGTPCHEDWNKMIPNSEGRHCEVCDKTVVDLTTKSQTEMIALYEEKGGDMCGRMVLPRPTMTNLAAGRPAFRGRLRNFALALFAALGLLSWNQVIAQGKPMPGKIAYHATFDIETDVFAHGEALQAATVQLKVGRVVVRELQTDERGHASFQNLEPGSYTVVVRFQNQKVATRQVDLLYDDQSIRIDTKVRDGIWQEEEPTALMGDVAFMPFEEVSPVEVVEEPIPQEIMEERSLGVIEVIEIPCTPVLVQPTIEPSGDAAEAGQPAIESESAFSIQVFPNPIEGRFQTQIRNSQAGTDVHLIVFDESGRELTRQSRPGGGDLLLEVELGPAAIGIYFVRVINGNNVAEKRVVKL